MAGRPSKSIENCTGHRTKSEREVRATNEEKLATKTPFREWQKVKEHPAAHAHFLRLKKLYKTIGKDDGLIENIINRYCIMQGECSDYEKIYNSILHDIQTLDDAYKTPGQQSMDCFVYIQTKEKLYAQLNNVDKRIQKKRAMLLAIEKENAMTLQGILRAVPKRQEEEEDDPFKDLLNRRRELRGDGVYEFSKRASPPS